MVSFTIEMNQDNYEDVMKNEFVLVDVWAKWCQPCKIIGPIVDDLSAEYQDKITVAKIDADENKDIVSQMEVRNIPTLILYKNGEVLDRMTGVKPKAEIKRWIDSKINSN